MVLLDESMLQPKFAFSIRHYAGVVTYSTAGFVEKNKDQIHDELSDIVQYSTNGAMATSYRFVEDAARARAAAAASVRVCAVQKCDGDGLGRMPCVLPCAVGYRKARRRRRSAVACSVKPSARSSSEHPLSWPLSPITWTCPPAIP